MLQVGDVLLAAAFVSYAGPFNMTLRQQLIEQKWRPDLVERCIPLTDGIKPLDLLTGEDLCGVVAARIQHLDFCCGRQYAAQMLMLCVRAARQNRMSELRVPATVCPIHLIWSTAWTCLMLFCR
jgi:hypothetical protein